MKKENVNYLILIITIALISFGLLMPGLIWSGSLEPTAAPAPTMKALDEVESRIPIPVRPPRLLYIQSARAVYTTLLVTMSAAE